MRQSPHFSIASPSEPSWPYSSIIAPACLRPFIPVLLGGRSVWGFAFQRVLPATASRSGGCRVSPGTQTRARMTSSLMLTVGGHPGAHGPSQEGEGRGLRERQGMQVKVGITCEKFWLNSSTWGQGQDEMKPPGVWGLTLTLTWYQNVHGVWQVGTVLSNPPTMDLYLHTGHTAPPAAALTLRHRLVAAA